MTNIELTSGEGREGRRETNFVVSFQIVETMSNELVSSSSSSPGPPSLLGSSETRLRLRKYFLDKLDSYAEKSSLWQIFHASHIHRNLMRKSRHLSKIHSISEDIVRQCISQLLDDLDEYIRQMNDFFSSHKFDQLFSAFEHKEKNPSGWHQIQLQRARQLFPSSSSSPPLSDEDLLDLYYKHVEEKHRPPSPSRPARPSSSRPTTLEQLNETFAADQSKAKEFLKNFFKRTSKDKSNVNLDLLDQMIKLGSSLFLLSLSRHHSSLLRCRSERHEADSPRRRPVGDGQFPRPSLPLPPGEGRLPVRAGLHHRRLPSPSLRPLLLRPLVPVALDVSLPQGVPPAAALVPQVGDHAVRPADHELHGRDPHPDLQAELVHLPRRGRRVVPSPFDLLCPSTHVDQWTWLFEQWRDVLRTMPLFLTESGSFTRLVRTTIGIGLMHLGQLAEQLADGRSPSLSPETINDELFRSLQVGFYFGISYAVVDSLQDQLSQFDWTNLKDFLHFNTPTTSTDTNTTETTPMSSKELIDHYLVRVEESLLSKEFREEDFPSTPFSQMLVRSFDNLRLLVDEHGRNPHDVSFFELALLLRAQRFDQRSFDDKFTDEDFFLGLFSSLFSSLL